MGGNGMQYVQWDQKRLAELVTLWNEELGNDFPMRTSLFEQNSFSDENILHDASLIVENDQGEVIGFILTKVWQEKLNVKMDHELGWIQAILVKKSDRRKGIGSYLLRHAEAVLRKKQVKQIRLAGDVWHYFPGIPHIYEEVIAWAEKRGYEKRSDEYDLIATYHKEEPFFDIPDHMTFTLLREEEKADFLKFLNRSFPGRWEYEAIKYFEKGGKGREFLVLKSKGRMIGFCRINDHQSPFIAQNVYWQPLFSQPIGGIGPLGIDENERGSGYGLAIVKAAINTLRKRHIETIVIDWTSLIDFYNQLGFYPWKGYGTYFKEID